MRRLALGLGVVLVLALGATVSASADPAIQYSISGRAGDNGWYLGPVTVTWAVSAASVVNCPPVTQAADTAGWRPSCTASDPTVTLTRTIAETIRIDQTPPAGVAAAPARAPDSGPWYTSPIGVRWSGTDALSGIAACTAVTYGGPDDTAAVPAGTCRDGAGNVSGAVPFRLAYDGTAPALTGVAAKGGDGVATLNWSAAPDTARLTVVRTPGNGDAAAAALLDGATPAAPLTDRGLVDGVRYTYTVTARDVAGNATSASAQVIPGAARGGAGARTVFSAGAPPLLRWPVTRRARYYNVQLFRGRHKILSTWPRRSAYRVHSAWRYGGRRHRLARGAYLWYVWPGYGARSQRRYGKLLSKGRFRIR